jgi:hypothetical protein
MPAWRRPFFTSYASARASAASALIRPFRNAGTTRARAASPASRSFRLCTAALLLLARALLAFTWTIEPIGTSPSRMPGFVRAPAGTRPGLPSPGL